MHLEKLTNRIYYLPHQPELDRPMLAYIKGEKFSLAIDAGYSKNHVLDFYNLLKDSNLKLPDFTAITHWHYDHTFAMHCINGASIANKKTNEFLEKLREKAIDPNFIDVLKNEDEHLKKEYVGQKSLDIVASDIEFEGDITINLGGVTAKIFSSISPHSSDSVCVYIPEEKVLFLGDATSEDFFNNSYMDKEKLQSLVNMIENKDCVYCVLGHAEPLEKQDLLEYLYSVLENLQ